MWHRSTGERWHHVSSIETRRTIPPSFIFGQLFGRDASPEKLRSWNTSRSRSRPYFIESDSGFRQNCRLQPTPTPASTPTPQHCFALCLFPFYLCSTSSQYTSVYIDACIFHRGIIFFSTYVIISSKLVHAQEMRRYYEPAISDLMSVLGIIICF